MATATVNLGTSTALTATLASLATDANLLVGRESNSIDNTTTLAVNYVVAFEITTGTSPTAAKQIEAWASFSEDGTNYDGNNTGADAARTHTAESKVSQKLLHIQPTNSTSDTTYRFSVDLKLMPGRKANFFIVHNTGVNLNATAGNQSITYTAVKYDSA